MRLPAVRVLRDKGHDWLKIYLLGEKQFAVEKLRAAKTVTLRNIQRGKYFRIVADVYVDDKSLGDLLLEAGHAKPYDGKKKKHSWCG